MCQQQARLAICGAHICCQCTVQAECSALYCRCKSVNEIRTCLQGNCYANSATNSVIVTITDR